MLATHLEQDGMEPHACLQDLVTCNPREQVAQEFARCGYELVASITGDHQRLELNWAIICSYKTLGQCAHAHVQLQLIVWGLLDVRCIRIRGARR